MYTSVALDLDNVIYDYLFMVRAYFPAFPSEPLSLDFYEYLNSEERRTFYTFLRSPHIISSLGFLPGALDFLTWIRTKFKSLYVVTARDLSLKDPTEKQIKEWPIAVDKVLLEKSKEKVVPDLSSIFFEDDPKQLNALKSYKFLKLLVPLRSYNKKWIQENIGDSSVYPYTSFDKAKEIILHLLEENNG